MLLLSSLGFSLSTWADLSTPPSGATNPFFFHPESVWPLWPLALPGLLSLYGMYRIIRVSPTWPDAIIGCLGLAWFLQLTTLHWLGGHISHDTLYAVLFSSTPPPFLP